MIMASNNNEEIITLYEDNILLKIKLIDHFMELREKQMKILDEYDVNVQNKVKMIRMKSKKLLKQDFIK